MYETPHAFFHLDHPGEGSLHPAGPLLLRGWVAGRPGRPLVDLRVRMGGSLLPAILGFPRADLAAFFKLRDPFLPGGFEVTINLLAGEHTLRFEGLTLAGVWHEIGTVRLVGQPAASAAASLAPAVILPHEFARLLQVTLRHARHTPVDQAARTLTAALPRPAVLRYPHVPFHGHLHQPTLLERVLFGRVRIEGWLFHEPAPIRRVVATVDLQTWQDLEVGGEKAYVTAMFPQFPQVRNCRIDGLIDVPAQLPNPICVRLYAQLEDGTWHLCQVQRVHVWDQEQEKSDFVPFARRTFIRTALALDRAGRACGFTIPHNRDWWRGLYGVYQEYRTRTDARRPDSIAITPAAPTPPTPSTKSPLQRVTLITHNLGREGAPLFLFELARQLAANGTRVQVISGAAGPLADAYQELGATVQVVDIRPLHASKSQRELQAAISRLAGEVRFDDTDLVIANTLSAFWGVHLAHQSGRPSLFYIHESTTPATFYLGHMAPATLPLIEDTFRLATHVSFLTETSRVYYRPWLGAANHGINPGWIDVNAIDAYLTAHPREVSRRSLTLAADTRLVINIGTVCDRKGQHLFARAVDLLWRRAPELAQSCLFLMVGGNDTLFDRDLQHLLVQLDRPNIRIVPSTSDPLAYYNAADLFVCSSFEESFPRVILEAMTCRVPILSTGVHGILEMIRPGTEGLLVPPGDTIAMEEGLVRMLSDSAAGQGMAARARERVITEYAATTLLPRHTALATTVAAVAVR